MKNQRLDQLTPEQEAQMEPWADLWIKRGLSTEEADWEGSERGIRECYQHCDIPWHNNYVRAPNPLALAIAAPLAGGMLENPEYCLLSKKTRAKNKRSWIARRFDEKTEDAVLTIVREVLHGSAQKEMHAATNNILRNSLDAAEKEWVQLVSNHWNRYLGGCFWVSWQAYESFFREVCKLDLPTNARAESYALAQMSSGWWWPHRRFVVVCDRPKAIHLEQVQPRGWNSHRLHSEDGAALEYRDGWGLWCWHGFSVDQRVIEQPETITLEEIEGEANAETRRILIERYGETRYLTDTGAKIVHVDYEGARKGAAPRMLMEDKSGERYLIGTDGSTKRIYSMKVPNEVKTCREAHERLCGFDETLVLMKS